MQRIHSAFLALLLPLLLPAAALARDPGGEFQVTPGIGSSTASAGMDDKGGFVISWLDYDSDVKARRFSPDGKPVSGEFAVGHVAAHYSGPIATTLDRSGFLVVWEGRPHFGSPYLTVQRFDRDGHPLVRPFSRDDAAQPNVASSPRGSSVIVWVRSGTKIVATRRDPAGQPAGPVIQVAQGTSPDVAVDAAGNFVVAWASPRGVFARQYGVNGAPRGATLEVSPTEVGEFAGPALAGNRQGRFAVVWATKTAIWARFYSSSGEPLAKPVQVTGEVGPYTAVDAAMDSEGKLLVAWDDCCSELLAKTAVYGRWFDSSGAPSGGIFGISDGPRFQDRPAVASGPKNRFLVVWDGTVAPAPGKLMYTVLGRRLAFARPGDDPCFLWRGSFVCDTAHDGGEEELLVPFRGPGSDLPLLGDLDGDGDDDPCRYRSGQFLCDTAHDGGSAELTLSFGQAGDRPLLGDVDGEGKDDACVYRDHRFLCDTAHNGGSPELVVSFGRAGDLPFLADVGGDGDDDPCVARDGLLLCDKEHDGGSEDFSVSVDFGAEGDVLLLGDVDDDGRADPCVHRDGRFLCDTRRDGSADLIIPFTFRGAIPLLGNMDGL